MSALTAPIGPSPAYLEIDVAAIVANWRILSARHGAPVAGVVKADGYGLGAQLVADHLFAQGCRHFFVAHLSEALSLRAALPGAMLAVFNGMLAGQEGVFVQHGITPVLNSLADLDAWRVHGAGHEAILHIDTGMSRLGLDQDEFAALRGDPARRAGVNLAYVMTHLVSAEQPDAPVNRQQAARCAQIRAAFPGIKTSFANSSGIFWDDLFRSDLARPGAALYGVNPTPGRPNPMRDVVRLVAPVLQVRAIAAETPVGYNGVWIASRPSKIATVAVGYADGYLRSLSGRATARFDGHPIPLVGRVSMDLATFDVTDFPAIRPGTALELIGPGHGVDALAAEADTNGYEILTALGARYERRVRGL